MCGRYTLAHTHAEIMERFQIEQLLLEMDPRYNIAPSQAVPIVIEEKATEQVSVEQKQDEHKSAEQKPAEQKSTVRTLQAVKWGLVPSWVRDPHLLKPMINARVESLAGKPMFKSAFKSKRCLIPADSFYEWMTINKKKCPLRIQLKTGELFALAGLYDDWISPEGERVRTCAIITVPANDTIAHIHNRMPAILRPEDESVWLNDDDPDRLTGLLKPFDNDALTFYRVSPMLNSARVDSSACIEPLPEEDAQAAVEPDGEHETSAKRSASGRPRRQRKSEDTSSGVQLRLELL